LSEFLIDLARALVRTPSVNPSLDAEGAGEGAVAALLADVLRGVGCEVELVEPEPGRPSVLAVLRGRHGRGNGGSRAPSLMLNGHIDTVDVANMDDPFSGDVSEGRLHGRGAYDMKGAVAACVAALREVALAGGGEGDLWLSAVADEEVASLGSHAVIDRLRELGELPDAAIVTEPTSLQVCVAHKGFVWSRVRTRGRAAHGSRPDLGIDANLRMARLLAHVEPRLSQDDAASGVHPLLGRASFHVGELNGGTGPSSYAEDCTATIERRTLPGQDHAAWKARLAELVTGADVDEAGGATTIEHVLERPAFEIDRDHPLVGRLVSAAGTALGRAPSIVGASYWMDTALFAAAGIPTVVIGPHGDGAHAAEEWVDLGSLDALARILARLAG